MRNEHGRTLRAAIWNQFGAAMEMLGNALKACPDEVWADRTRKPEFWYVAFHTLFFLDFYLTPPDEEFAPPAPFTLDELDPAGLMPERVYTKDELREYLSHGREKCRAVIAGLTEDRAWEVQKFHSIEGTAVEILLYNLRHVQHHAGQLNLMLRERADMGSRWVSRAATTIGT